MTSPLRQYRWKPADAVGCCYCDKRRAGAERRHNRGPSPQRIGPENRRIHEVVVDTPVEHVNPPQTVHGLHPQLVVRAHQLCPSTSSTRTCCERKTWPQSGQQCAYIRGACCRRGKTSRRRILRADNMPAKSACSCLRQRQRRRPAVLPRSRFLWFKQSSCSNEQLLCRSIAMSGRRHAPIICAKETENRRPRSPERLSAAVYAVSNRQRLPINDPGRE